MKKVVSFVGCFLHREKYCLTVGEYGIIEEHKILKEFN